MSKKLFWNFWLMVILACGCLMVRADEPILKLDINDVTANTAAETEEGFTPFTLANNGSAINGVTITITGDRADDRRRGTPTGIPYEQIYRDFIFARTTGMTISLSGLEPGAIYEITLYSFDTGSTANPPREAVWTANGAPLFVTSFNGSVLPTTADDYKNTGIAVADGGGNLVLQTSKGPNTPAAETIYSFVNALIVTKVNQCYNFPPTVAADQAYSVVDLAEGDTTQLSVTVTDDGKPYQEGCNPDDPATGTPIGFSYTWSQVSGPATVSFDDANAESPMVTFSAKGIYVIQVVVADGPVGPDIADGKETTATMTIRVKNSDEDDFLLAHWTLEENSGTTITDTENGITGEFGGTGNDPNWTAGWIEGASPNSALLFNGVINGESSYVEITGDADTDPNLATLQDEITVSAWIKVNQFDQTWQAIVTKGDSSWRLHRLSNTNAIGFHCTTPNGTARAEGTTPVNDGNWHHVAGTYDGQTIALYVDGRLDASSAVSGPFSTNDFPVMIGGNAQTTGFRSWNGLIDDVKIFTYGMNASEIQALALEGKNLVPFVDAGTYEPFPIQQGALALDGTVQDDGKIQPVTTLWSVISAPEGGEATFADATDVDTTVQFSKAGDYTLSLTANDGLAEKTASVTITVQSPSCQDVINDGLLLSGDLSGPEGVPDCRIDLYDLAAFASNWLRCNDPEDSGCEFPY